jgi:DNA polymerase-3 subunit delta
VQELDKLRHYAYGKQEITKQDIDQVTTKSIETKIFDMLSALGTKKTAKAVEMYNNMIQAKTEPLMILSMLARQFRLILRAKALGADGYGSGDIAKEIGVPSFAVKEYIAQGKNFKYSSLIQALEDCLDTDIKIKTGQVSPVLGVEMIVLKFG